MATQAQTAVRYEIEKHNNISETTQLSFKIDKHERFLDVTDSARIVTSGNFHTFDGLLFIVSFNFSRNRSKYSRYKWCIMQPAQY